MLFKRKKIKINGFDVKLTIEKILNDINSDSKVIVYIEIKDDGNVILHCNRPGILIGRQGINLAKLNTELKKYGVTKLSIKEMIYIASNCGV